MDYISDCTFEASPVSTTFPPNMAHKIHVLLVEHDSKDHDITKNMLHYFSYEVTAVKLASTALSILSTGKAQFDLVMANMNSLDDLNGFQLLRDAVKMNLLVILMSNDDDALTTMRALEQGAFLCIKKPVTMKIMEYLWEHVVRENAKKFKQSGPFEEVIEYNTVEKEFGVEDLVEGNNKNKNHDVEGRNTKSKKNVKLKISNHDNVKFKRKFWIRWTKELHEKFMDAVTQLGEGRCYPKEILQLMNAPGLTRMQVASHLQICRNTTWLPLSEKKPKQADVKTTPLKKKASRAGTKKVGSMPCLGTNFRFHQGMQEYRTIDQEFAINDPPRGTIVLGDKHNGSSNEENHGNNPVAQNNETIFNMGQLIQTFSMDETLMHGAQNVTPVSNIPSNGQREITEDAFEFPNLDNIIQDLFALQQELGINHNGGLKSIALNQVNHNQISTVNNATNQWSQDVPKSLNDEATKG